MRRGPLISATLLYSRPPCVLLTRRFSTPAAAEGLASGTEFLSISSYNHLKLPELSEPLPPPFKSVVTRSRQHHSAGEEGRMPRVRVPSGPHPPGFDTQIPRALRVPLSLWLI